MSKRNSLRRKQTPWTVVIGKTKREDLVTDSDIEIVSGGFSLKEHSRPSSELNWDRAAEGVLAEIRELERL
jgi:hypothetical protein